MYGSSKVHAATLGLLCVALTFTSIGGAAAQGSGGIAVGATVVRLREVTSAHIAQQLGMKLSPDQADELALGTSITGSLVDPSRLAALGVSDVHAGARVVAMRVAPDRVRVEIDEVDPAPRLRGVTLRLGLDGQLSAMK